MSFLKLTALPLLCVMDIPASTMALVKCFHEYARVWFLSVGYLNSGVSRDV